MSMIKYYAPHSWMVARWDKFNGGKRVEPKSFCQFWRTVILWASLASVPVVGKLFLSHLWEDETKAKTTVELMAEEKVRQEAGDRAWKRVVKIAGPPSAFVWWLVWPLRAALYGLWRVGVTAVAFVDERERLKQRLDTIFGMVMVSTLIALAAVGLGWLGYLIYLAWQTSALILLIVLASILPALLGSYLFVRYVAMPFTLFIAELAEGLWHLAVSSKHRVCPPMEIIREEREYE